MTELADMLATVDEDWLAEVIDDSLDVDWTGRIGARAIISALEDLRSARLSRQVCQTCGVAGDAEHKGFCSGSFL